jgi:L-lactate dehydrogenase (cytochrome)
MDMMQKYPRISDMVVPAERKLPKFVHAYLAAGTGIGQAMSRNEKALSEVDLMPRFLRGRVAPDTNLELFGQHYAAPFGIAPVGLQSLIWPNGEALLAKAASAHQIPYTLSTVAGADLETIGPIAGDMAWYQLYAPSDKAVMRDLLKRAKASGFKTLVVTVDVPGPSRREEMRLAGAPIGSRNPMSLTPRVFWQCMTHPSWSLAALAHGGKFSFKNLVRYNKEGDGDNITTFIGRQLNGSLTWDYLAEIRAEWDGPLVVKGILHLEDARQALKAGADALVISNHGGRQLDAAPPSITILPQIRQALGSDIKLFFDSGVRSGLDIARALASGADFVLLGRAFMFGLACLGAQGGQHVGDILKDELQNTMVQLGVTTLEELKATRK